jgi:AcrR family transcriptional regulator
MTQTRVRATATRRRAILEAGLACFTARGIAATTMDDIRAASGASIGSIFTSRAVAAAPPGGCPPL